MEEREKTKQPFKKQEHLTESLRKAAIPFISTELRETTQQRYLLCQGTSKGFKKKRQNVNQNLD